MNKKLFIRIGIFLFLFYLITFFLTQRLDISIQEIQNFVLSFGVFSPITYSVILFLGLCVPFNPISDFLIINMGAILFPPFVAILFTFIAHSLAITVNYFVGKKYGKKILNKVITPENSKYLEKYFNKLTIKRLFLIRFFVPISSMFGADILSYISGMQRLPFLKYYAVSIIPWTSLTIIYFTVTSYLINRSIFLYFLPAIIIVIVPLILYYLYKFKIKKD
jgi:uncharacterized membrane protein YdjX (TVP38/TMEM64 family)